MKGGSLRKIRLGISIPLFLLFFLSYLGEELLSEILSHTLVLSQFLPSLIRFLFDPVDILGWGCVLVLLLTFIWGRVYCSFLCPLGMLQDLISWSSRKVGFTKRYVFREPYKRLHLGVFFLTLLMAILGYYSLLNLLDPYGFFGRISTHLGKDVMVSINNLVVNILEIFDIYDLSIKKQHHVPRDVLIVTGLSFGCLLLFSSLAGRLHCNTFCPVGALLGIVSRFSLYKLGIEESSCTSCNACERICKAGCIQSRVGEVDHARCVSCFNCLSGCPTSSIGYRLRYSFQLLERREGAFTSPKRRALLGSMAAAVLILPACPVLGVFRWRKLSSIRLPITPPGSLGVNHFIRRCSGCHLCVSACPTHTLVPNFYNFGLPGLLQPSMDYHRGHCEVACTVCSSVCPTGAIMPLTQNEKKLVQIGVVTLKKDLCIVHTKKIHCGACGEACPTNAIFPVEKGRVAFPEIDNQYCIGCGACEHACPTVPKSIVVTANSVHKMAKVYVPLELPVPDMDLKGDFPF